MRVMPAFARRQPEHRRGAGDPSGQYTVGGTSSGVPTSGAGAFAGALFGASALGDASKDALESLNQDLNSTQNFQQLSDNLQPTFITVKMFCLGVECETN